MKIRPKVKHSDLVLRFGRAFNIWKGMKRRCLYSKGKSFSEYKGRGITICNEWRKFQTFLKDMGQPGPGESIERVDNNGPYCRENCCWIPKADQARNTRRTKLISFNGKTQLLSDWARELGVLRCTLHRRMQSGLPIHVVLSVCKVNNPSVKIRSVGVSK